MLSAAPAEKPGAGLAVACRPTRQPLVCSLIVAVLIVTAGCRSPFYQDQLALFGGLTGAGIGALVGEDHGNALAGAAIGSAVGAAGGATVGAALDDVQARNQQVIEAELGRRLSGAATQADVISMVNAQLSDDVIITHIQANGIDRPPTAQDLVILKNNGVSDAVLQAMQTASRRDVAVVATPAPPVPSVVVERHVYGPFPPPYGPPRICRPPHYPHPRKGLHWGLSFSR